MSQFLLKKTILSGCRAVRTSSPTSNQGFLRDPNVVLLRWMSSSSNQQSFTVSYLVSSLGFSSQTALSVSKYVNFDTPDKADKVIKFFKDYGFTDTQISRLVRTYPTVLLFNAERKILPTLQFFESKGISGPEIAKMVTAFPTALGSSLANRILPSYDYMRNVIQSDDKLIIAVKNYPDVLVHNVEKYVSPSVDILREHGASESNIATIMGHWPRSFIVTPYSFRKVVEKVVEMGFDASKVNFVIAVKVSRSLSESTWERKVDAYKKWGWSGEDVLNAFKRNPWCMLLSEDKINACMDLFINKMGLSPCIIAKRPVILSLSLKKRLIPRFSVFQVLLSKGLVKKEVSLRALLETPEKKFLQTFVMPYKEEAPELSKLYEEKVNLSNGPLVHKVKF